MNKRSASKQLVIDTITQGIDLLVKEGIDLLVKDGGYPHNTVKDSTVAHTFGLMIGTLQVLRMEWEERDS